VCAYSDVALQAWVVTLVAGYTVIQNEKVRLDLLAGARYLYIKADTKLDITAQLDIELKNRGITGLQSVSDRIIEKGHVWDAIIGARGEVNLNEKWYLPYYADVGSGDSDLTWQVAGGVGYKFSKVDVILGYRYLDWEFDDDGALNDLDISGPYLGFKRVF
jgi:opacity protein-like surface antigen